MSLPALLTVADNPAIRAAIRSDLSASDISDVVVASAYNPAVAQVVAVDTAAPNYPNSPVAVPGAVGAASGGSMAAGVYEIGFSWVYNTPPWIQPIVQLETAVSPVATVTLGGSASTITVTPPVFPPGAIGFNVYMSQPAGTALTRQNLAPVATATYVQTTAPTATGALAPTANSDYWQHVHDAAVLLAAAYLTGTTALVVRESFQGYSYGLATPLDPNQRAQMLRELAYEILVLNLGENIVQLLKPSTFVAAPGGRGDVSRWPLNWQEGAGVVGIG